MGESKYELVVIFYVFTVGKYLLNLNAILTVNIICAAINRVLVDNFEADVFSKQ